MFYEGSTFGYIVIDCASLQKILLCSFKLMWVLTLTYTKLNFACTCKQCNCFKFKNFCIWREKERNRVRWVVMLCVFVCKSFLSFFIIDDDVRYNSAKFQVLQWKQFNYFVSKVFKITVGINVWLFLLILVINVLC